MKIRALKELDDNKRHFISSKSTFHGSGQWTGHFFDHIQPSWEDLHLSIVKMLQFNQFGIPLVGSNICTSPEVDKISDELCIRSAQLGSFHPLASSHIVKVSFSKSY